MALNHLFIGIEKKEVIPEGGEPLTCIIHHLSLREVQVVVLQGKRNDERRRM